MLMKTNAQQSLCLRNSDLKESTNRLHWTGHNCLWLLMEAVQNKHSDERQIRLMHFFERLHLDKSKLHDLFQLHALQMSDETRSHLKLELGHLRTNQHLANSLHVKAIAHHSGKDTVDSIERYRSELTSIINMYKIYLAQQNESSVDDKRAGVVDSGFAKASEIPSDVSGVTASLTGRESTDENPVTSAAVAEKVDTVASQKTTDMGSGYLAPERSTQESNDVPTTSSNNTSVVAESPAFKLSGTVTQASNNNSPRMGCESGTLFSNNILAAEAIPLNNPVTTIISDCEFPLLLTVNAGSQVVPGELPCLMAQEWTNQRDSGTNATFFPAGKAWHLSNTRPTHRLYRHISSVSDNSGNDIFLSPALAPTKLTVRHYVPP